MTRRIDRSLSEANLPPLERSAWVEVDVNVLTANARALVALANGADVAAVVKADGYGHGLEMAARCAVEGGARWLCVADSREAQRLRQDGYAGRVFVLYPVPVAMASKMARLDIDVSVASADYVAAISRARNESESSLRVHMEVDTGMTRGGVNAESAVDLAHTIVESDRIELAGVWTHLAAPEDYGTTSTQLTRFDSLLRELADAAIAPGMAHVAASGGLLTVDPTPYDLVRPGLVFYGSDPGVGSGMPEKVGPSLSVRAYPVRVTSVPAGTAVGYAGTWTAERQSTIATIPVGYADGWARSLSPGSHILVGGHRAPVVGRISSDAMTIDVTDIDGFTIDTEVCVLGKDGDDEITVDEIAELRGTISWEVLQQLGARLARVYVSHGESVAVRAESTVDVTWSSRAKTLGYG